LPSNLFRKSPTLQGQGALKHQQKSFWDLISGIKKVDWAYHIASLSESSTRKELRSREQWWTPAPGPFVHPAPASGGGSLGSV
jgi:hypothetical protein